MSAMAKRLLAVAVVGAMAALLVWAFIEGRAELAREREREQPIKVPPRVARAPGGELVVTLDHETQGRVGLTTAALGEVQRRPQVVAYGTALDAVPLATLSADLSSAEAALAASQPQLERLRKLYQAGQNMSRKALELAEAQYRADENRVHLARRQMAAAWGDAVAGLADAARETLVRRLVARETVLARVDLPAGEAVPARPVAATLVALGYDERPVTVAAIFDAPTVERSTQGQGFLLRIDRPTVPLRPGAAVTAYLALDGEPQLGVVIPRAAVVRFGGAAWAYVEVGDETFSRRSVALDHPTDEGWFETSGFAVGDRVVVAGAQLLLSEELKSQIQIGD